VKFEGGREGKRERWPFGKEGARGEAAAIPDFALWLTGDKFDIRYLPACTHAFSQGIQVIAQSKSKSKCHSSLLPAHPSVISFEHGKRPWRACPLAEKIRKSGPILESSGWRSGY
jgi:hypothetical protein